MGFLKDYSTSLRAERALGSIAYAQTHLSEENFKKMRHAQKVNFWYISSIFLLFAIVIVATFILIPSETVPAGYTEKRIVYIVFETVIFIIAVLPPWLLAILAFRDEKFVKYKKWYDAHYIQIALERGDNNEEYDRRCTEELAALFNEPTEKKSLLNRICHFAGYCALYFLFVGGGTYLITSSSQPNLFKNNNVEVPTVTIAPASEAPISSESGMIERMKQAFPDAKVYYTRQVSNSQLTYIYTAGNGSDVYFDRYELVSGTIGSEDATYNLTVSGRSETVTADMVIKSSTGTIE